MPLLVDLKTQAEESKEAHLELLCCVACRESVAACLPV